MNTKYRFLTSLILSALLLAGLTGCLSNLFKKEEDPAPKVPKATQTGAMTLGCFVDGQVWNSAPNKWNVVGPGVTNTEADYSSQYQYLQIKGRGNGNDLKIEVRGSISGPGIYPITYAEFSSSKGHFETDSLHIGKVNLTFLDTNKKIVSGFFSFKAKDVLDSDSIHITGGVFDLLY